MNDIEKRARELLAKEHRQDQRRAKGIRIGHKSVSRDDHLAVCAIIAALALREGELLAGRVVNLLDQHHSGVVAAQVLEVVPAATLRADEAGAVGIGGQRDQSIGVELAEVASEHEVGVPAARYRPITGNLVSGLRNMLADIEKLGAGPLTVDTALLRQAIAALTPPEGYADAVRDAARYRYIRGIAAGEPSAFGRIEDAAFAAHYGDPTQFDFNIDEQMAGCPEVSP